MKKLRNIKLTQLSDRDLNEREMGLLLGSAGNCGCGCLYEGQPGGSSTGDNSSANNASDLHSPGYNAPTTGTGSNSGSNQPTPTCTWINTNYICYNGPVNCNNAPNKC